MQDWKPTADKGVEYGLGLYRVALDEEDAGELWGHDGRGNAFMYYWPARGIAFAGTLNQSNNDFWPLVAGAAGVVRADGVGTR